MLKSRKGGDQHVAFCISSSFQRTTFFVFSGQQNSSCLSLEKHSTNSLLTTKDAEILKDNVNICLILQFVVVYHCPLPRKPPRGPRGLIMPPRPLKLFIGPPRLPPRPRKLFPGKLFMWFIGMKFGGATPNSPGGTSGIWFRSSSISLPDRFDIQFFRWWFMSMSGIIGGGRFICGGGNICEPENSMWSEMVDS